MRQIIGQKFQGDEAAQLGIFRFIDNTHPTAPKLLDDEVMGNALANQRVGGGHVRHILS